MAVLLRPDGLIVAKRFLVVLGSGGHASVVIDLARQAGWTIRGCIGPAATSDSDCPHLGDDEMLDRLGPHDNSATVGVGSIGNADVRRNLFNRAQAHGFAFPVLVHPRATIASSADLGDGTQVMAGAVVQPNAKIGRNAIINSAAVVEHHAEVGDHAHVAPGAVLCGNVVVGAGCHVGANATVLQGMTIGDGAMIAAGAVVTRHVAAGAKVMGIPAR